jgi:hypothetical protein
VQSVLSRSKLQVTTMEPYGVTGDTLDIRGQQTVTFRLNGGRFTHPCLVCTLPTKAAGLLGTDFLYQVGTKINFAGANSSVHHTEGASRTCSVSPIGHVALTVFSQGKAGHRPLPEKRETEREDMQLAASLHPEEATAQDQACIVRTTENVTVQPTYRQIILGLLDTDGKQNLLPLVCIEPALIPTEGIRSARRLADWSLELTSPQESKRDQCDTVKTQGNCVLIMFANLVKRN